MKKAADKNFELEVKISNYETGYVAPRTVKIEGNHSNDFQSNSTWNASWNPEKAKSNQKKSPLKLDPQVIKEIGVEGAKKWRRDVRQHLHTELCKKSDKRKQAIKKRIAEAHAKGEQDPLFIKYGCPCEEAP